MARVKLSELSAKKLLYNFLELPYNGVSSPENLDASKKYVAKVDEGVKKRMKQGLVVVDKTPEEVSQFIADTKQKGYSHFIIEEFVPHESNQEMYLSIERVRDGFKVFYARSGGIEIEEKGGVSEKIIHADNETEETAAIEQELGVPQLFISQLLGVMNKFHFSFLEINPLLGERVKGEGVSILDLAVEADSAALFFVEGAWSEQDVRTGDVKEKSEEEKNIDILSSKSQASFKFVPLNPNGSIFMLLSGGGASIVLADEVANLGKGEDLANYGEYSGNPSEEETYIYTKNLLSYLLKSRPQDDQPLAEKVLIIAGGVANFTDVRITFRGITKALDEVKDELKEQGVKVYVRRGGPNQEEGLASMSKYLEQNGLYGDVKGPELVLTDIVKEAFI